MNMNEEDLSMAAGRKRKRYVRTASSSTIGASLADDCACDGEGSSSASLSLLLLQRRLASALSASEKSAVPLRRLLSGQGVLASLLLLPTTATASASASALKNASGTCRAQLLSVLYDEIKAKRNVEAVVRFVRWLMGLRALASSDVNESSSVSSLDAIDDWAACLSFMIAFDALFDRVKKLDEQNKKKLSEKRCSGDTSYNLQQKDIVISISVNIIHDVRDYSRRAVRANEAQDERNREIPSPSLVERCFAPQISRFDHFVANVLNAKKESNLRSDREQTDMDASDITTTSKGGIQSITLEESKPNDWWSGVDLPSSDEDEEDDVYDNKIDGDTTTNTAKDLEIKEQSKACEATLSEGSCKQSAADTEVGDDSGTDDDDVWRTIETAALDLRAELVELSSGATSSDIQSLADKIVGLIQRSSDVRGALGFAGVGRTLMYGTKSSEASTVGTSSTSDGMPFSDVLLQQLTKACIDGSTSAFRASAYIKSFVLPVVLRVGGCVAESVDGVKKKVAAASASRVLTTTITNLSKERPLETVEALFVPLLSTESLPTQAHCEIALKAIKSAQLTPDAIMAFLRGIVGANGQVAMKWTESSIPILTALLSKKVAITSEIVRFITSEIESTVSQPQMDKSMKFSNLFSTFVTKHGPLIVTSGCTESLILSAQKVKTFTGKSIKAALKKLKKAKK